jgi:aminoglycoside phosphotransferase (APT) family kinase protein
MTHELQTLSTIVGAQVLTFERCAWGFENRTDIVTLADGRKLVVQRVSNHELAPHKLRLAQLLPDRLAQVGIRLPRQLAADATASPPYAVREYLPGVTAATFMRDIPSAVEVATAMGALLRRLRLVATDGLQLHSGWADPARIARQARAQLDRCRELLDEPARHALAATIDEVAGRFAGRGGHFAHGDFCPVNALVMIRTSESIVSSPLLVVENHEPQAMQITALLDVEFARLADPLFDAAWWGWVVRYHHYERWVAAWPALLAAAGIVADEATLGRVRVIQRLRCLEAADYARATSADAAAMWAGRLRETLGWA